MTWNESTMRWEIVIGGRVVAWVSGYVSEEVRWDWYRRWLDLWLSGRLA